MESIIQIEDHYFVVQHIKKVNIVHLENEAILTINYGMCDCNIPFETFEKAYSELSMMIKKIDAYWKARK